MMTSSRIAILHLIRRRFSTAVVLVGIVLAVATSGLLLRLYRLSNERFATIIHTGDAIVGAKSGSIDLLLGMLNFEGDYPEFIPLNLYQTLKSQETIHFEDRTATSPQFIHQVFPFVAFAKRDAVRVYATSDDFFALKAADVPELEQGTVPTNAGEIVIGQRVAEQQNLKLGDFLTAASWVEQEPSSVLAQKFKVVGIWRKTDRAWDRIALANWQTAERVFADNAALLKTPWGAKVMHFMLVYLKPGGFHSLQSLINQRTVAQSISVENGFQKLDELTGTGRELGLLVAAIILLLSITSVASMMMGRFESMTVQMAVLRALGYSKKDLSKVLIYEALYLSFIACLLGALIDAALFPWLRSLLGASVPGADVVSMQIWQSWPVWAAVVVGNILSVLYPIWRISKQNIHMSLRSL